MLVPHRIHGWWLLSVVALAGCHTYNAVPLDPRTLQQEWQQRQINDADVAAFAKRLSAAPASAEFNPADGVSLAEAQAIALVFNPELRLARRKAGVTQALSENAGLWDDPVLGVDLERIVSGVPHPWVAIGTIGLTLPLSGRLEVEKQRASAEHVTELTRVAAAEWELCQKLRQTWAEWSLQKMRVELLDDLIKQLDAVDQTTQQLVKAGSMTRVEARTMQIERASRQAERLAAAARLEELRLEQHAILGLAPGAAVTLVPELEAASSPISASADVSQSYLVRVAQSEYTVAERTLEREIRAQFPDITIGPGGGSDQGDSRVVLGLSMPIPLWNRNAQAVSQAIAARLLAAEQLRAAIETQSAAVSKAMLQAKAAQEQRALLEKTIVPIVDEQMEEVRKVAKLGDLDILLVLDSMRRQHDAKLKLLDVRGDEIRAAIKVIDLIGPTTANREKTQ